MVLAREVVNLLAMPDAELTSTPAACQYESLVSIDELGPVAVVALTKDFLVDNLLVRSGRVTFRALWNLPQA